MVLHTKMIWNRTPLRVKFDDHSIKVSALLDSGASACFIDKDFAEHHKLPLVIKNVQCP